MRTVVFCMLFLFAHLAMGQDAAVIAPWSLGDSREQVIAQEKFGPYRHVPVTGGLETAHGRFMKRRTTISFVFDETERLKYMQVWLYEGPSFRKAKKEALRVFDLFSSQLGGATMPGIEVSGSSQIGRNDLSAVLDNVLGQASKLGRKFKRERQVVATTTLDLVPQRQPGGIKLVGQFVHSSRHDTYFVFLFQDVTREPDRRAGSNVFLEKL